MTLRFFVLLLVCISCSPLSKARLDKSFRAAEKKYQDHKGFVIYDPLKGRHLYEYHSNSYFTPASNTKVLTLLTSLNVLGDSIPALNYVETADSLVFWGMADPSFLYDEVYQSGKTFSFLKNHVKPLYFSTSNFSTSHFGSGWAWDDFNSAYSAERSPLPIYGNCLAVYPSSRQILIWPSYFKDKISTGQPEKYASVNRDPFSNQILYHPGMIRKQEWLIPFRVDQSVISTLLSDTLSRRIESVSTRLPEDRNYKTLYSGRTDSLYSVMMKDSDNLIAEHLLMMCSGVLQDSLKPEIAIDWAMENVMSDLPDEIKWVDGSGLSRYNLITPRSMLAVWRKLYDQVPRERLFKLLATGGQPGTLKNWYKSSSPYLFGKTGTLSNNHALSGFLVTKSGKTLIFCFMNANFTASMNDIRKYMQAILDTYYEKY